MFHHGLWMKTQSLLIVFWLLIFFNFLILYYVDGRLSLMIYFIYFFFHSVKRSWYWCGFLFCKTIFNLIVGKKQKMRGSKLKVRWNSNPVSKNKIFFFYFLIFYFFFFFPVQPWVFFLLILSFYILDDSYSPILLVNLNSSNTNLNVSISCTW